MVEIEEARTREVIICPDSAAALETLRVGKSKARPDTVNGILSVSRWGGGGMSWTTLQRRA